MLHPDRIKQIFESKDTEASLHYANNYGVDEHWAYIDGVLVVFDPDDVPAWLKPGLENRDDDGNHASFESWYELGDCDLTDSVTCFKVKEH